MDEPVPQSAHCRPAGRRHRPPADRGEGIAEDDLPLVFERFHRSTSARSLPGSGLGLSIVAEVARTHGGQAFAMNRESGEGVRLGAVVGMRLPTIDGAG